MLEFLQTGKAVSVLAAICLMGIISKCITRSLYRRLLKETNNMAMTRNKNLKALKQKLENAYRLNQNIVNSRAYLEKQMYDFRFMRLSLDGWNNISMEMILLGLLVGGAGSFLSYWYRLDASYIVLYSAMGALSGLLLMFLDSCFHIGQKQQKLETVLLEYMDNSVFVRAVREGSGREAGVKETLGRESAREPLGRESAREPLGRESAREPLGRESAREPLGRESAREALGREANVRETPVSREQLIRENEIKDGLVREEPTRRGTIRPLRGRNAKADQLMRTIRSRKEEADLPVSPARRDIDSLKQSLDQIAASREADEPTERDWTKDLSKEEIRLIGEIMRQYFSENG